MKAIHRRSLLVGALAFAAAFQTVLAETYPPLPPGPYAVGCTSVEQDFTRMQPGESPQQYWEGIPADNGRARYITDLLTNSATPVVTISRASSTRPTDVMIVSRLSPEVRSASRCSRNVSNTV